MQKIQGLQEEVSNLLDSADSTTIKQLASVKRSVREKAIYALTISLNVTSGEDNAIFQSIPMKLMERGDTVGAIWYIETV